MTEKSHISLIVKKSNAKRRRKSIYIKIIVAAVLMTLLVLKIDFLRALTFFYHLNAISIALILLISFWLLFTSCIKWKIFLSYLQLPTPFWKLFNFYLMGYFFNNFLPTNFGGDTARFLLTAAGRDSYSDSFVAVFMERFTGLLALLIFVTISIPLSVYHYRFIDNLGLIFLLLAVILGGTVLILFIDPDFLMKCKISNRFIKKVSEKMREILSTIQSFKKQKRLIIYSLFLSILFNFLAIVNVYIVAWALEISLSFFSAFVFVPVILVISAIPLSINGLGISEGAYVLCLTQAGISAPAALSIALFMRAKNIILSVLGGIFLIFYRKNNSVLSLSSSEGKIGIAK